MRDSINISKVQPPDDIRAALEALFASANGGRGRELSPGQTFAIATYISKLQHENARAIIAVEGMDRIIMAYVAEHGEDIMTELFNEELEGEYVEAEYVEEETGRTGEDERVDPSVEGEEE